MNTKLGLLKMRHKWKGVRAETPRLKEREKNNKILEKNEFPNPISCSRRDESCRMIASLSSVQNVLGCVGVNNRLFGDFAIEVTLQTKLDCRHSGAGSRRQRNLTEPVANAPLYVPKAASH